MEPSRKKQQPRSVFDVRSLRVGRRFDHTINLRPKFWARQPWGAAMVAALVIILALFGMRKLLVRAEVADFYPSGCLGTWKSPEKAQGEPESLTNDSPIDVTNAAVTNSSSSQIFCGGFIVADAQPEGEIREVGLTLRWNVEDLPAQATTTESIASTSTETIFPGGGDGTSTVTSSGLESAPGIAPTSFIHFFLPESAYAEEVSSAPPAMVGSVSTTTVQETSSPTTNPAIPSTVASGMIDATVIAATTTTALPPSETVSTTSVIATTVMDAVAATSTTSAGTSIATTTDIFTAVSTTASATISTTAEATPIVPPEPDENFLMVSYSIDGQTWVPLKKIGPENWQALTLAVPIKNWDDLKKIQIKLEGIPSILERQPTMFLDGMFIEVHYELSRLAGEPPLETAAIGPLVSVPQLIVQTQEELGRAVHDEVIVSPQFKASDEWIAYKADMNGEDDIFVRNQVTSEVRQLTHTPFSESEPVAAGGKVAWAYATGYEGSSLGEIYLYDILTNALIRVTNDGFLDQAPRFEDNVLVWDKFDAVFLKHKFSYDLGTGVTRQIDEAPFTAAAPPEEGSMDSSLLQ